MIDTRQPLKVILSLIGPLALIALVAIVFETILDKKATELFVSSSSYYLILGLCCLWVWAAHKVLAESKVSVREFLFTKRFGFLSALLITICVFLSVDPTYHTLSDETDLIATSKSMFYDKTIYNSRMGKWHSGFYNSLFNDVPRRPILFPFAIHLVHQVIGYSYVNGFIVNFLTLFSLLMLAYLVIQPKLGAQAGVGTMLLVAAQPVVAIHAASSGFDLFAATVTMGMLFVLYFYLRSPSSSKLFLLWLSLLLLLNSRYECFIYAPVVAIGLLVARQLRFGDIKNYFSGYCVSLFFVLPFFWQTLLTDSKEYRNSTDTESVFSFEHFTNHLGGLINAQFDFSFYLPYATILNWIGLVAAVAFLSLFLRNRTSEKRYLNFFTYIAIACILVHLTTILSFWSGWPAHPSTTRYYINLMILLSLAPALYAACFRPALAKYIFPISVLMFVLYHPVASYGKFMQTLAVNREIRHIYDFIQEVDDQNILLVSQRPGPYTVLNIGSVNFHYLNKNFKTVANEFRTDLYKDIYVAQIIKFDTQLPAPGNTLREEYKLSKLEELQYTPFEFIRISKMTDIVEKPKAVALPTVSPQIDAAAKSLPEGLGNLEN